MNLETQLAEAESALAALGRKAESFRQKYRTVKAERDHWRKLALGAAAEAGQRDGLGDAHNQILAELRQIRKMIRPPQEQGSG